MPAALAGAVVLGSAAIAIGHDASFAVHGTIQIDNVRGQLLDMSGKLRSDLAACAENREGELLFRGSTGVVSRFGGLQTNGAGAWKRTNVRGGRGTYAADFPKRTVKNNRHHTHRCKHSQAQVDFP
jgi:hypothetical protein